MSIIQSLWGLVFVLSLAGTAAAAEHVASQPWSQWRGPTRDGNTAAAPWPAALDESQLVRQWSISLQPSYSGPIVWGDRVFTTETVDERIERVVAVDRQTGETLWTQQWQGAMKVPFFAASHGSWIRATPACDGQRVYVGGMLDVLVALDVETGKVIWRVDFVDKFESPLPSFGFVSSPLVDGNALYVQAGGGVVKLDKTTGETQWRSLADGGGMYGSAFSSPIIDTLDGVRQLIVQSRERLAGIDLETGKVLWTQDVPAFRGMNILTPTVVDNHVFTSSYGGKSFCYTVSRNDTTFQVESRWENKVQGYMSSPVVIDGHVYMHLRNRRFTCIDLQSGQEKWITKPFGEYWSLIARGDRILALDENGELLLIHANPESFELIDRRQVSSESSWAHLANDEHQLFIRGLTSLTAYRWVDISNRATKTY